MGMFLKFKQFLSERMPLHTRRSPSQKLMQPDLAVMIDTTRQAQQNECLLTFGQNDIAENERFALTALTHCGARICSVKFLMN